MTHSGAFSTLRRAVPDAIFITVAVAAVAAVIGYEDGAALLERLWPHVSMQALSSVFGGQPATVALLSVVVCGLAALDAAILRHVYRVHALGRRPMHRGSDGPRFHERS